jgi:hypothetical protein
MPSSYTPRNRLTKQAPGEGLNVWGTILNTGVFELIDVLADGIVTIGAAGATTLSAANGAADQARARVLNVTARRRRRSPFRRSKSCTWSGRRRRT